MRVVLLALLAASVLGPPAVAQGFTSATGEASVAALDEVCGLSQAAATAPAFAARMERQHGWSFADGVYSFEGAEGTFKLKPSPAGCTIAVVGPEDPLRLADRALIAWADRHGLRLTQPDTFTDNHVGLLRRRGDEHVGKITYSLLVWADGSRPSELDVAYARPK